MVWTLLVIHETQTVAIVNQNSTLEIKRDHPVKHPGDLRPGECLVKMCCTGVCHTDLHARRGDWPVPAKNALIGGHEGVGEIVAIGAHTADSPVNLGQRVGIKWIAYTCLNCEQCRSGLEQNCSRVKLSGFNIDGTFAQYVVSYVQHVTPIPDSIDSNEAASILCAGLTVYRALKYSGARIGDWVVLPGAGGGLGHLAIQYACAMGLKVVAIDTGAQKKELCEKLGAMKWIDFKESNNLVNDVIMACDGLGAHCAVVTAENGAGYIMAVDYLRAGGTLMAVGLPGHATFDASIFYTVFKNITIKGSYVGNRQDAIEALDIAVTGKVKVHYALKSLSDLGDVYEGLAQGKVAGRVVLEMK